MKTLVLAGAGHAHLGVLRLWARQRPPRVRILLINPTPYQYYSGMLPGWIEGLYTRSELAVDLRPLCEAAGAEWVQAHIIGMDADRRCVGLGDRQHMDFDLLSLDIGAQTNTSWLEDVGDQLLPVKPLDAFLERWSAWRAAAGSGQPHVAVLGGGAAGFELAMAAHAALGPEIPHRIDLITGNTGLLPSHHPVVRTRAQGMLNAAGIVPSAQRAVGIPGGLLLADGTELRPGCILAATGARPHEWLCLSKLALDEHGYVAVDAFHRSLSHPWVFAAGDTCSRTDTAMERSGVHSVHSGPVLAHNLAASLCAGPMQPYQPRARSLYLLACGRRRAIASWGPWSAQGQWVWRWKNAIDQRFMGRYRVASAVRNEQTRHKHD
ncbi:MAG: FAD-dependent oxidoreductase [Rhodoferax sp.]